MLCKQSFELTRVQKMHLSIQQYSNIILLQCITAVFVYMSITQKYRKVN